MYLYQVNQSGHLLCLLKCDLKLTESADSAFCVLVPIVHVLPLTSANLPLIISSIALITVTPASSTKLTISPKSRKMSLKFGPVRYDSHHRSNTRVDCGNAVI